MSAPAGPGKRLDDYEYAVRVHEVDPDTGTVTLLFEEVDGLDGFAVQIEEAKLQELVNSGRFDDWAAERVAERIEFLGEALQLEEKRRKASERAKSLEDAVKSKRVKAKKR